MVFRTALGPNDQSLGSLLVDTSMQFPVALDDGGWQKAGVALSSLKAIPDGGKLRQGLLPRMALGAFDVPKVPGVYGAPLEEFEKGLDVNLDGMVGSGLLAAFRVTLADGGRTLWLEDATMPEAVGAPESGPPTAPPPRAKPPG
jgi:hypothetical protein